MPFAYSGPFKAPPEEPLIEGLPSAAECLYEFETYGRTLPVCSQPNLLACYRRGKAMRDWWTKEIGWWRKQAVFIEEEFLSHLLPKCFEELFGNWPRSHLVREIFDNHYSTFTEDQCMRWLGLEREANGWRFLGRNP